MNQNEDVIFLFRCCSGGAASTETLVRKCAARFIGAAEPPEWRLEREERGKPYFPEHPEICFSVTHSGEYWMCAMARQPVGLDLQREQDCRRADISRRFFHPEEDAWLRQNGYRDFFELWAAKESCVKYTGQGIADGARDFSVLSEGKIACGIGGACLRKIPFREGWSLYLCSRENASLREIDLDET